MKRYILIYVIFIVIVFILPVLFTKKNKVFNNNNIEEAKIENNENNDNNENKKDKSSKNEKKEEDYNYKEYSKIKLLHSSTGKIEELPLDTYLLGVVSAEMPASFEQEALNAQAVVARTYTIYSIKHNNGKHDGADICDNSNCCQAWISKEDRFNKWENSLRDEYWNKIFNSVRETKGKIIVYDGEPIDAFFHSNSGGSTETPVNVWGGTNFPYLQSVQTAGEDAYSQYSSEVTISKEELKNKIKEKHSNFEIDYNQNDCIRIMEYTDSNRVKTIKIGNIKISGVEMRSIIGLKSANFQFEITQDSVKFKVVGYGHGVGMSQTGADSMAKQGNNYQEIIKHFYTGVQVIDY